MALRAARILYAIAHSVGNCVQDAASGEPQIFRSNRARRRHEARSDPGVRGGVAYLRPIPAAPRRLVGDAAMTAIDHASVEVAGAVGQLAADGSAPRRIARRGAILRWLPALVAV